MISNNHYEKIWWSRRVSGNPRTLVLYPSISKDFLLIIDVIFVIPSLVQCNYVNLFYILSFISCPSSLVPYRVPYLLSIISSFISCPLSLVLYFFPLITCPLSLAYYYVFTPNVNICYFTLQFRFDNFIHKWFIQTVTDVAVWRISYYSIILDYFPTGRWKYSIEPEIVTRDLN